MRIGKHTHIPVLLALLGGAGGSGLHAQGGDSPYSYLFKIRGGLTAGDMQKTHFDNKVIAFAAEVKYEMPAIGGALTGELAWEYVPGRHHDVYPWGTDPLNLYSFNQALRYSFDNRKEYGQGFNVRLGYAAPMPQVLGAWANEHIARNMDWFGGLSIDRFKVRSEVKYTLNFHNANPNNPPIDGTNPANPAPGLYDGGAFVKEGSSFSPGLFAGLKYRATDDIGFELSLRNFGMYHYEFTPAAYFLTNPVSSQPGYSGEPYDYYGPHNGRSKEGTTRGWAIEIAITAKL